MYMHVKRKLNFTFQFGFDATTVGFVFLIPATSYAITAPLVGKFVDKLVNFCTFYAYQLFSNQIIFKG